MYRIVVMGVSGSGKTTTGLALAHRLGVAFVDADDLHPPANVAKMASSIPLTDEDRWPWLESVARVIADAQPDGVVVACSALRRAYRDVLTADAKDVLFLHLDAPRELLERRMSERAGHFMPPSLLASQLETLEPLQVDENGLLTPEGMTVEDIVSLAVTRLGADRVR